MKADTTIQSPEETARNLINSMSIQTAYDYSLRKARGNFPLSAHYIDVNQIIQANMALTELQSDLNGLPVVYRDALSARIEFRKIK
jgi:uncharacterized ferritin-like protein (DUF455 family)